jgi:hypothetical protein
MSANKNDKKDIKPDHSLLPKIFMDQVAYSLMAGEVKYGRYNFYKGHKLSQLTAAISRHTKAIDNGEDIDQDTSLLLSSYYGKDVQVTHAACIAANVAMMLAQKECGTLTDDRFKSAYDELPDLYTDTFSGTSWEDETEIVEATNNKEIIDNLMRRKSDRKITISIPDEQYKNHTFWNTIVIPEDELPEYRHQFPNLHILSDDEIQDREDYSDYSELEIEYTPELTLEYESDKDQRLRQLKSELIDSGKVQMMDAEEYENAIREELSENMESYPVITRTKAQSYVIDKALEYVDQMGIAMHPTQICALIEGQLKEAEERGE